MNTNIAPKIPKLVSHSQFVTWCVAEEDAILAAGAHTSLRETGAEPTKPVGTEKLVVTAADLQVYFAELAYYRSWKDKDGKARGMIFQNVPNGLRMNLQSCASAKEAWEKLAKLHQVDNDDYRADIRNQLSTIVMSHVDEPDAFVKRSVTLLMTAKVAKLEVTEAAKCSDFLRALPSSYDILRSEWRTQCKFATAEEDKTFDTLSELLNAHVLQLQRQKDKSEPTVIFGGRQGRQEETRECWNCGEKGHLSTRCPKGKIGDGRSHKPPMDRSKPKTAAELEADSSVDDCSGRKASPVLSLRSPMGSRIAARFSQHYSPKLPARSCGSSIAAPRITYAGINRLSTRSSRVHCPCGTVSPEMTTAGDDVVSEEDGIVAMSLPDSKKLVPQDVTHLPSAPASWLSLGSLQQKGWTFDFIKGSMSLGSHPLQMYNVGPRGRLQKGKLHAICLPLVLPERKVVKAVPLKIADSSGSEFKMEDCEVCAIAKATRLTFGNVSVPGKVPLEIVHSDIAGPLKPAENGDVYYITYIDDFTGYLFAYSLPDKTALGVLNSFKFFQAMVERAFSCKIQVLRTDGGGEYKDIMGQYLRQAGIVQQVTTPYTPQRNGRAERMNRTIKEILASMLIDAKIGMRYWNYGLKHALVLWNTGRVFDGVTLEERGHKRRVDYSKIQPFGAECWVRIPPENRRKADLTVPKAWKGKLLSINFPGSGYIVLLDGDAEELIFSRDVPKLERPMQNSIIT